MMTHYGAWGSIRLITQTGCIIAGFTLAPAYAQDLPSHDLPGHALPGPDLQGGRLNVNLDEAKLVRLPERVATIVIGNPLIADASLQPGGLVVLTGKGYGATNFIALDRKGNALLEKTIQVHGDRNLVTVFKGVNRESYACAPTCQPVIAPGDVEPFFNRTLVQTTTRSTQATSMSAPR